MRVIALLVAVLSFVASNVSAEEPFKFSPSQRLKVAADDGQDGGDNVEMKVLANIELPAFIKTQLDIVAENCTDSAQNANKIKVFSYVSDYNRRKKLPPNFIVDMLPLINARAKPCSTPPVCRAGRCNLWGFSPIDQETWTRTFVLSVSEWGLETIDRRKGVPLSIIRANIGFNQEKCPTAGGIAIENGCVVDHLWKAKGLSVLRTTALPPIQTESDDKEGISVD